MFAWAVEKTVIARYLLSGAANTLVCFSLIFGLMGIGVSAYLANISGYALGLAISFYMSRNFVFNISGTLNGQILRYSLSFFTSVGLNILVLHSLLEYLRLNIFLSQFLAGLSYTAAMFLMNRFYVFKNT